MTVATSAVDQLCINTIRILSIDAVQKANSGHPGLPLGAAPMAFTLWHRHLKHDPSRPDWPDRDRFVLSAGHGSMLLYSLLHLYGYPLTLDDLKSFRQWGSRTPGHPEFGLTPGVEATTGPLGQGCGNSVGMAVAERYLAHRFNRPDHALVDHRTWALVSDGDLMEGVASEAASLAGHLKLGKLVWLYDCNHVSLDGPTSLAFSTEDVGRRFEAYGWRVLRVEKGDTDLAALEQTIAAAKQESARPTFIVVKTTIGYGAPKKQGTSQAHGSPLGDEEVAATKKFYGFDPTKSFVVPEQAKAEFARAAERGRKQREEWERGLAAYSKQFPRESEEWRALQAGELTQGFDQELPTFPAGQPLATRQAGAKAVNFFSARIPSLLGGDADLSTSTNTNIEKGGDFDGQTGAGRNLHFGVREHAMGALANGMAYHGLRPYTATFFCFSDYMKPTLRIAALSHLPVIFVFTHDSIGLGEDGPTHQPVEHLMALRAVPNLHVVRPCDANETVEAWRYALLRTDGPTAIVLTRQKLPVFDRTKHGLAAWLRRGAYILAEAEGGQPKAIVIATGSEVGEAMKAREQLTKEGIPTRVVSMPCWEAFAEQDASYREAILPAKVRARVSIEAGATLGWERYVGPEGRVLGIDHFGASAPAETIFEKVGLTAPHVVAAVKSIVK